MSSEKPFLPFEIKSPDHREAIELVQEQRKNEQILDGYIQQFNKMAMQLRELDHERRQVERKWIKTGGSDPVLTEQLYKLGEEIANLQEKMLVVYTEMHKISDLMKETSRRIKALLKKLKGRT
jgi:hypothetical protein